MSSLFPFQVGQKISKSAIHQALGGSDQHGMTSCQDKSAFLLFHNEAAGRKYGYDRWEGWQADGSFHYTGQGASGDQKFTRSNKSLLSMAESGKPIYLFHTAKSSEPYVYIGMVVLGEPRFQIRTAPDAEAKLRQVIVFHLVPIGKADVPLHTEHAVVIETLEKTWTPPPSGPLKSSTSPQIPLQIELEENKLQARFGEYMCSIGESVKAITISIVGQLGDLRPDFYLESRNWVVEAKPSGSREHVRLAIGQVLDYSHLLRIAGKEMEPAILLPVAPPNDLAELVASLGIHLIVETSTGDYSFS